MFILLKIIHIGALMFGSVASLGNLYMMFAKGPHDLPSPAFANKLRYLFRITGLIAILALWITGPILMFIKYGPWVDGSAFLAKIGFATLLLLIISFLNLMAWFSKTAHKGPPFYAPTLLVIAAMALFSAMVSATIAFG